MSDRPTLSASEYDLLTVVANQAATYDLPTDAGPLLADALRRALPDLPDTTIGRVLLAYADDLSAVADRSGCALVIDLTNQAFLAALDLTSLDRGETPR